MLIVSSRTIQYLEQASRGEINAEVVFTVVLLRLPEFLELILPLGFFLSIVLTIGRLRADSEFVIMEQAGLSALKTYYPLADTCNFNIDNFNLFLHGLKSWS